MEGIAMRRPPTPPPEHSPSADLVSASADWLRHTEQVPARPTTAAMVSVLVCTSFQTLLISNLLLAAGSADGAQGQVVRTWPVAMITAVVVVGAAVLLIFRSRAPLLMVLLEGALFLAASVVGMPDLLVFPLLFALFSVVTRPPGRQVSVGIGSVAVVMAISSATVAPPGQFGSEFRGQLVTALVTVALAVAARSVHGWQQSRRCAVQDAEAARTLTRQRDRAVARARVAAELHDGVGHKLTTIIALAEGLADTTGDPEIDEALDGINTVAREGLEDTRRAVRALADDQDQLDTEAFGWHDWTDITAVIARVRSLGVRVVFTETGRRVPDPPLADLCFAVTREALTNAVRHTDELAQVVISWDHHAPSEPSAGIVVTVRSTSTHSLDGGSSTPSQPLSGTGLRRLRDRVARGGGTLTAGRTDSDEWTLRALLLGTPMASAAAVDHGAGQGRR
ncbi:MAG: histidine kinase [Propionibacteriales bacterium]|nr:histidine kinase [Propionibacteriales bacterium]